MQALIIQDSDAIDAFTCFVGGSCGAVHSLRSGYGGVGIQAQPFALVVRHGRRRKGSRRGCEKEQSDSRNLVSLN